MVPNWLTFVNHTADEYIEVTAENYARIFERAAWAMFSILTDMHTVRDTETWTVNVAADDREALLVRWLSELNVLHQLRHIVLARFTVRQVSNTALKARVHGEAIDPERHCILTEIKAVTYHGLQIKPRGDHLVARIMFDL